MRHSPTLYIAVTTLLLFCGGEMTGQIFPSPGSTPAEERQSTFEQTRLLGGISLATNLNAFSRGIPMVYTPICNHLEAGTGLGYSLGLHATWLTSPEWSVTLHGKYAYHGGTFERFQVIGRSWAARGGEEPGFVTIRIDSDIDYAALEGDLMFTWMPATSNVGGLRLGLTGGPWVGVPVSSTMSQDHVMEVYNAEGEFLTERDVKTFGGEEIHRSNLADGQDMERTRSLQYGLKLGAIANYHLGRGVYLAPAFTVDLPVESLTDFRWGSLTTWSLGADLSVGL